MFVILSMIYPETGIEDTPDTIEEAMKRQEVIDFLDGYKADNVPEDVLSKINGMYDEDKVRRELVHTLTSELYFKRLFTDEDNIIKLNGSYDSVAEDEEMAQHLRDFIIWAHRALSGYANILISPADTEQKDYAKTSGTKFFLNIFKIAVGIGYYAAKNGELPFFSDGNSFWDAKNQAGKIDDMGVSDDIIADIADLNFGE